MTLEYNSISVNSTSDKILAAALSLFTERGYETATIHEIRSRAGVSNGSLFHFFSTKQDIAGALFAAITDTEARAPLPPLGPVVESVSPIDDPRWVLGDYPDAAHLTSVNGV